MRSGQRWLWVCPVGLSWIAVSSGCENTADTASSVVGGSVVAEPATHAQDDRATSPDDLPSVRLVRAFVEHEFDRPIFLTYPPGQPERLFVVEQAGRILALGHGADAGQSEVFLDIHERINNHKNGGHNEEGLLGLAFHPDYVNNSEFYVYYSAGEKKRGVLARFRASKDNPNRADPASEEVILTVDQPYGNHNGSTVLFGPDGFLYVSYGDGGSRNDPHGNGQNLATLLASIIRIDVDGRQGDLAYAIPKDNPFVKRPGARPEIWAYGLRNIWRMSFDRETGDLWAGDVGQELWEEIILVRKGGNYGWNIREGFHAFLGGRARDPLLDPVHEYHHRDGLSVTGGYVYRGTRLKRLIGAYVYGDYAVGRIWALRLADDGTVTNKEILKQTVNVASFSEGPDGELYMLGFDGKIYIFEEV